MLCKTGINFYSAYSKKPALSKPAIAFGYNEELNNKLLEEARKKNLEKEIKPFIDNANSREENIVKMEKSRFISSVLHDKDDYGYYLSAFLTQKTNVAIVAEQFFPSLNYSEIEAKSYENEENKKNKNRIGLITTTLKLLSQAFKDVRGQNPQTNSSTNTNVSLGAKPPEFKKEAEAKEYWIDKNGIIGMDELKEKLWNKFLRPIMFPDPDYDRSKPTGELLYGPPGCGKTHIAKKIANMLNGEFIEMKLSEVGSPNINQTSINIKEKVDEAKKLAQEKGKCVLFIDEADSLISSRAKSSSNNQHRQDDTNTLLQELQTLKSTNVYVILATNHKGKLDEAAIRKGRISGSHYVDLPDKETRKSLLKNSLSQLGKGKEFANSEKDINGAANLLEGYSISDIIDSGGIIDAASNLARDNNREEITLKHIEKALEFKEFKNDKKDRETEKQKYADIKLK